MRFAAVNDAVQAKIVNYTHKWLKARALGIERGRQRDAGMATDPPRPTFSMDVKVLFAIQMDMLEQEYAELLKLLAREVAEGVSPLNSRDASKSNSASLFALTKKTNNLAYWLIVFRRLRAAYNPDAPKSSADPSLTSDNKLQNIFEWPRAGSGQTSGESKSLDVSRRVCPSHVG